MLKIAWDPCFVADVPEGHRFPMAKYELIPLQLLHEGIVEKNNFFSPNEIDRKWVTAIHDLDYICQLENLTLGKKEQRRLGLPLTKSMVSREYRILEGTKMNADFALEYGVSFNVAGGTHHAYTDRGEGFCLMNDIAVAANYLLEKGLRRILVVDLDVHQGQGTAEIFNKESRVFTFSAHGKNNYPLKKEKSDLDLAFLDGVKDDEYLDAVETSLLHLVQEFKPEFVFYQAGVDALSSDKLGRLSMTASGLKKRDEFVFSLCHEKQIPVAVSMGGGYSSDIKVIVDAHCTTFKVANQIYF